MAETTGKWIDKGPGCGRMQRVPAEVSLHPRLADISQLQSAYLMHRQECRRCTPDQSCDMARRMEDARRMAGTS